MYRIRNHFVFILCVGLVTLFLYACNSGRKNVLLVSPDSIIQAKIKGDSSGYLLMAAKGDFTFIDNGDLGLMVQGHENLFTFLVTIKGPFSRHETVTEMGINASVDIRWNEYLLEFDKGEQLEVRVFDQGIAYRYKISNGKTANHVLGEQSSWGIPAQTKVWFFERNNHWKLKSYAGEWLSTTIEQLPGISETGNIHGKPLVFEYKNGLYGILAEAGLFNYSGMRFEVQAGNKIKANFSEGDKGFTIQGAVVSPWRVALVADDLNHLVNQQNIITSLNPEPDPELFSDRSWIKPGRSVWSWWSNLTGTPEEQKKMVGYAKELGFEYNLIDATWEDWPNKWQSLEQICKYGKENNVAVWVWKHSQGLNFPDGNYEVMQSFMDSLRHAGVSGIKVDFIDGESKSLIDFDEAVLRHAAKRKLMVNFHGIQTATGEIKRYPNEMTREGIRGLELNTHPEGPIKAAHNAALPFTRFVLGHGDYTPLAFTATGETTWAHQLATLVIFTSPFQVIAENPEILLKHPAVKKALPLIKKLPGIWDETIVLPGSKIGNLAAIARRKGNDWYVGVLNGGGKKKFDIDISPLCINQKEGVLYYDGSQRIPNPISKNVNSKNRHYSKQIIPFVADTIDVLNNRVNIELQEFGGAVLVLGVK